VKGNEIVLAGNPKGVFLEGIITDTSYPGTIMEMVPAVAAQLGRFSWRASTVLDGYPRLPAVLLTDDEQGFTAGTAYTANRRGRLYVPAAGEDLNVIVDVPGTGAGSGAETIGERLMIRNNGHLIVASAPTGGAYVSIPFICCEALPDFLADPAFQLTWVTYTGSP
jgi:hypothetical protein